MTVLPSQKLTTGELCVSVAAGLMLFLLPGDAKNQFTSEAACESFVFIVSFVIASALWVIIKRFDAIGAALMTLGMLEAASFVIGIISGIAAKGAEYWPKMTEYRIISLFIMWIVPFLIAVFISLLQRGPNDTNDRRRAFARFMSLSMKALLIIYALVAVFKLVFPERPHMETERTMVLGFFERIGSCLNGSHAHGISYIVWHMLILSPLLFYLSVLIPRLRIWHSVIIGAAVGLFVEALQYIFNTSSACTDDIILFIIGAATGWVYKSGINALRRIISDGTDPDMLSFDYTPVLRPNYGEPEPVEET